MLRHLSNAVEQQKAPFATVRALQVLVRGDQYPAVQATVSFDTTGPSDIFLLIDQGPREDWWETDWIVKRHS